MSLFTILYNILIGPLELVFEIIYAIAYRFIGHPGLAIIVLSLIMNFLVLPLYKRSDAMQEESRDVENKLKEGVAHIKKTFSGDEQMMILQTYYSQNNYKPTDVLNGSVSLLLQVPFFMAAYNFLSSLAVLQGVSLGPIKDLGAPDALITIAGISINVLPVLMTLVNIVSSAIYVKGFPLKTKIQLYGMALFFLVFLYTSPSGLVFYWTLNNVFSLVKTIFYKFKNPGRVLSIFASILGVIVLIYGVFVYESESVRRELFVIALGVLLQLPAIISIVKNKIPLPKRNVELVSNKGVFLLGSILLTVLVGGLIPSTLLAASPQEFIDITYFYNPMWYIVNSLCFAAGVFLVWMRVFYWIANQAGKVVLEIVIWALCVIALVNYLFFGTNLGIISSNLLFENGLVFSKSEILTNCFVIIGLVIIAYIVLRKWQGLVKGVLATMIIALLGMSIMNVSDINPAVEEAEKMSQNLSEELPHFSLSKEGQNIAIIMLDRAMGEYIPYLFNEKPELQEQFDGFTYYSNVISHGGSTNFGVPGLMGGYEYTPIEMNKRDSESLMSKHNEALKVMPVLFSNSGYDVTVCDPPYANYQWIPDLSIYSDYPEIQTYITEGQFGEVATKEQKVENNKRNFFCYSVMKVMPLVVQDIIYNNGEYNQLQTIESEKIYSTQTMQGNSIAEGVSVSFMNAYNVLLNLSYMTHIEDSSTNTFMMLANNVTHEPILLQEPDYVPAEYVDNTVFDAENTGRFTIDEVTLQMNDQQHFIHYQTNMATMLRLGEWFDYLRENDVYDNTRIIIVSDHGRGLYQIDQLAMTEGDLTYDLSSYYPLLMVKDFNGSGFETSMEFMTNADVPTIATQDLIENPVNPFTGNVINNDEKYAHEQYVFLSSEFDVNINNGTMFIPDRWYAVKDNLWEKANWRFINEVTTMPSELQE